MVFQLDEYLHASTPVHFPRILHSFKLVCGYFFNVDRFFLQAPIYFSSFVPLILVMAFGFMDMDPRQSSNHFSGKCPIHFNPRKDNK
jgi:hypothetical protein